jgi:hypothetical protein
MVWVRVKRHGIVLTMLQFSYIQFVSFYMHILSFVMILLALSIGNRLCIGVGFGDKIVA